VAESSAYRERLTIAVKGSLHAGEQWKRRTLASRQDTHFENVIRANGRAILFALAASSINDRRDNARQLLAGLGGRVRHIPRRYPT